MHRKLAILLFVLPLLTTSCLIGQLKYDRQVQAHMETLLTAPDETILNIIEEWNANPDLTEGQKVNLEYLQENVVKLEYDNKKGECTMYYVEGLDQLAQQKLVGQVMVIYGSLYWEIPEQKRAAVKLRCYLDDTEVFVMSWQRGADAPRFDDMRQQGYI
jgi:hypothetical protein